MWAAYETLCPFGDERADLAAGVIASTIVNVQRRKGDPPLPPLDFMPLVKKLLPKQTVEEAKAVCQRLALIPGFTYTPAPGDE